MISPLDPAPLARGPLPQPASVRDTALRRQAQELEAAFLSAMLSHSGLDGAEGTFSGGVGEAQFASFLRDEQARLMVASGGIGLAEQIFESLVARSHG